MKSSDTRISYKEIGADEFFSDSSNNYVRLMFNMLDAVDLKKHNLHMALADLVNIMNDKNGHLVLISLNGNDAGMAFIKHPAPVEDGAYRLEFMFVKDEFTGGGVGTTFVRDFVTHCANKSYGVSLACKGELTGFYQKNGFGRSKKVDGWEDMFALFSPLAEGDARFYNYSYDLSNPNLLSSLEKGYIECRRLSGVDSD